MGRDEDGPQLAEWTSAVLEKMEADVPAIPIRGPKKNIDEGPLQNQFTIYLPAELRVPDPSCGDFSIINYGTDLDSNSDIWEDNLGTIINLLQWLAYNVEDRASVVKIAYMLTHERPHQTFEVDGQLIDLNPKGRTYLELFGQSPFGLLANLANDHLSVDTLEWSIKLKDRIPLDFSDPDNFIPPKIIYAFTKAPWENDDFSHELRRHGGCPVLHKEYKNLDLINRLGKLVYEGLKKGMEEEASRAYAQNTQKSIETII